MKILASLSAVCLAGASYADATYLGIYLKGTKIGYALYESMPSVINGKSVTKNRSKMVLDTGMLGKSLSVHMDSTSWTAANGRPLRMVFDSESGGRSNKVDATFEPAMAKLSIVNGGVHSRRDLPVPKGGQVVDDPLALVLAGGMKTGTSRTFYVLDPSTATFMKNDVLLVGASRTSVNGKSVAARLIRVTDPTSVTDVFVNQKGNVVRVNSVMGIYMLPVSKTVALAKAPHPHGLTDLAESSSIASAPTLSHADDLSELKIRIYSKTGANIPSDSYQTSTKVSQGWMIDVHPPKVSADAASSIAEASTEKPEWLKPSLNMPCDQSEFTKLAASIVGTKKTVQDAAFAIQNYVFHNMRENAGIGVLRDATEVLATKEGVCRDYAILTVTLLRAAGIPARLASGLINWGGTEFYYHAWAEAWDGYHWIGIDSTTDRPQMCAAHVKLGEGNVETAFTFSFLENARISVLETRKN